LWHIVNCGAGGSHMAEQQVPSDHPDRGIRAIAGALTGLIAGIVMTIPIMLFDALAVNRTAFFAPNVIATWGGFPYSPGFGAYTMAGLFIHLVFSAFLGILWGLAFRKTPTAGRSAGLGFVIYGFVLYWVIMYVIAPLFNPFFAEAMRGPLFLFAHLLFGVVFYIYPFLTHTYIQRAYR
jgi:hypothetical protein